MKWPDWSCVGAGGGEEIKLSGEGLSHKLCVRIRAVRPSVSAGIDPESYQPEGGPARTSIGRSVGKKILDT